MGVHYTFKSHIVTVAVKYREILRTAEIFFTYKMPTPNLFYVNIINIIKTGATIRITTLPYYPSLLSMSSCSQSPLSRCGRCSQPPAIQTNSNLASTCRDQEIYIPYNSALLNHHTERLLRNNRYAARTKDHLGRYQTSLRGYCTASAAVIVVC
jgi:hypothetical protein